MKRILALFFSLAFTFPGYAENLREAHNSYSWTVHEIAKDFVLLDVWEFPILADKTRDQDFSSFLKIMQQRPKNSALGLFSLRHLAARSLVSVRVYMGEIFGLDKNINSLPIPGCEETSMKERLSVEDQKKILADSIGEGTQDKGIWQTVYLYENEMLAEHSNDTVHALMHFGWVQKSGNYFTAQLAVYAKPRGKWGEFYMQLIMPFRHLIVYPAMMEEVKKRWNAYEKSDRQQNIEAWEKRTFINQPPEKVMDAAGIKPGMIIGEVGAGRGRFTMHLARRVGPQGKILANDIDAEALAYLRKRCQHANITNVKTIMGEETDPLFPKKSLDMIFMVWVYHYVEQPLPLLKNLPQSLKPGGKVVLVEPKPGLVYEGQDHGISPERMRRDAAEAGLDIVRIDDFLPEDLIFVLKIRD